MNKSSGFTVIELLVAILVIGVLGSVFYSQNQTLQAIHRDQDRKIAINSIYYNLEEVVKPKLGSYPRVLKSEQLTAMDKSLLKDPNGIAIGDPKSDYQYEPTGCNGGDLCKGYTLRSLLEREGNFVKKNR